MNEQEPNHTTIRQVRKIPEHLCNGYCLPESGYIESNQSGFIPIFQAEVSQPGTKLRGEPEPHETAAE